MSSTDEKRLPSRPAECADTRCFRGRPCGVTTTPRPVTRDTRTGTDVGPVGVWLRRFAWARLRARTLYSVTGVFDGTDLP